MSETWTPTTTQAETWTNENPEQYIFSPLIFSHAFSSSRRVFAIGSTGLGAEIWDRTVANAETWTPA